MKITKKSLFTMLLLVAMVLGLRITTFADSPAISKKKVTLQANNVYVLTLKNVSGNVSWSTSKKAVASVVYKSNSRAVIKAKKAGVANITAKVGKKKLTCKVTVKKVSGIPKKLTLVKGDTVTFKQNGKSGSWASSNKQIASVSGKGKSKKIKFNAVGSVTIAEKIGKKTYKCKVTVLTKDGYKTEKQSANAVASVPAGSVASPQPTVKPSTTSTGASSSSKGSTTSSGTTGSSSTGSGTISSGGSTNNAPTSNTSSSVSETITQDTYSLTISPKEITLKPGESETVTFTTYKNGIRNNDERALSIAPWWYETVYASGDENNMLSIGLRRRGTYHDRIFVFQPGQNDTMQLPFSETITYNYHGSKATLKINLVDYGVPDKQIINEWKSNVVRECGFFSSLSNLQKMLNLTRYIARNISYTGEGNWYYMVPAYVAKHGGTVGCNCVSANGVIAMLANEYLGLNAELTDGSNLNGAGAMHEVCKVKLGNEIFAFDAGWSGTAPRAFDVVDLTPGSPTYGKVIYNGNHWQENDRIPLS